MLMVPVNRRMRRVKIQAMRWRRKKRIGEKPKTEGGKPAGKCQRPNSDTVEDSDGKLSEVKPVRVNRHRTHRVLAGLHPLQANHQSQRSSRVRERKRRKRASHRLNAKKRNASRRKNPRGPVLDKVRPRALTTTRHQVTGRVRVRRRHRRMRMLTMKKMWMMKKKSRSPAVECSPTCGIDAHQSIVTYR